MKKWILLAIVCLLGMVMVAAVVVAQDGNNPTPTAQEPGYADEQIVEPIQDGPVSSEQLALASGPEAAVGTGFSYQGRIEDGGSPVNGNCDFQFTLWEAGSGGTQVGNVDAQTNVHVSEGLFSVIVNSSNQFGGNAFNGQARWLQVAVRCPAGSGSYATLSPREALSAVPAALSLRPGTNIIEDTERIGFRVENNYESSNTQSIAISGRTNTPNSIGVNGNAAAQSGTNFGIFGQTMSSNGYGGYFINKGGGTALYAQSNSTWGSDLSLGGPEGIGKIYSPGRMVLMTDSDFEIHLDNNGTIANSYFRVFRGVDNHVLFQVREDGITQAKVLRITGGSDLSEAFDVSASEESLEPNPGMVVAIDAQNPGKLVVSEAAYDRTVAGVISGAGDVETGMLMGHDGTLADGKYPVALTGRVYVWADASYGAIQPGDLLTTSNTPGHAMKVTDHNRAQGAILGKAMTELDEGQSLVLVLVTLQ